MKTRSLESRIRLARLHARRKWIVNHGRYGIPVRVEVHHKDFCPLNNELDNLELLTKQEHLDIHAKVKTRKVYHEAMHGYLDKGLKANLDELTLWLNIYNTKVCNRS